MSYLKLLHHIASENGGIITNKSALENGISRMTLSNLCKSGKIVRLVPGQYCFNDELCDELYSLSLRSGNLVFSHETALFLHGLSDRVPFEQSMTAPSGYSPSCGLKESCKLYYVKPDLFEMGMVTLITPFGNNVPAYDSERTICDIIRSRSRIGTETLHYAMKKYADSKEKNLNRLYDYAVSLRVNNLLKNYLGPLL